MLKKMMLLALSVGALVAFAAPAAQAVELSDSEGALAVNAEVTATSANLETVTALGTLKCKLVTLHLNLDENGPVWAHLSTKSVVTKECNVPISEGATAGTITLGVVDPETEESPEVVTDIGLSTGASFKAAGACTFTGNIPFSFETGTDVLNITGSKQFSTSAGCGGPNSGTMTGSFTLETSNGNPITIN